MELLKELLEQVKVTEAAFLLRVQIGRARVELVTAVNPIATQGSFKGKAEPSASILINGEKHNVSQGRKKGKFDGDDVSWRQEFPPKTVTKIDRWLAKEIPANASKSK